MRMSIRMGIAGFSETDGRENPGGRKNRAQRGCGAVPLEETVLRKRKALAVRTLGYS